MTNDEDFNLLRIHTWVLKVNIHCDGCEQKVKKLLQKIEGVYKVNIDAEVQKVTVSGNVDSAVLIKKLVKAGKHAELWSQNGNHIQNHKHKFSFIKQQDHKNRKGQTQNVIRNLESPKKNHKFPFVPPQEDDCLPDFDDEEEDEEMQVLKDKNSQLSLLKKQTEAKNPGKKLGNGNGNPVVIDQKTFNSAAEGKRVNDINTMMNLAGFHGNNGRELQIQPSNPAGGFPVSGLSAGHNPDSLMMNMNGYTNPMNPLHQMYNRSPFTPQNTGFYHGYGAVPSSFGEPGYPNPMNPLHQVYNKSPFTPQNTGFYHGYGADPSSFGEPGYPNPMNPLHQMYNRSPFTPQSTGFFHGYGAVPCSFGEPDRYYHTGDHSSAHMFSDEITSSCSIL